MIGRRVVPAALSTVILAAAAAGHSAAPAVATSARTHLPHMARGPAGTAAPASNLSHCATGIQAQSLQSSSISPFFMFLYPQSGGDPIVLESPPPVPGGAANFYLPSMPEIPAGLYAAALESDYPVAGVARTDCVATGKSAMYGGRDASGSVVVPLFVKNYYGQCSILSIQNADTSAPMLASLQVLAEGRSEPALVRDLTVGAGTSVTLNACDDAVIRDSLPDGFLGSARVDGGFGIAVQAYVDIVASTQAMYAFEGVPVDSASRELFVPLVRSRQRLSVNSWMDTGISVVNPGAAPADVTLEYFGADNPGLAAACRGGTFVDGPVTVPPHGSRVFYLGPGGLAEPRPPGTLPENCVGSARISASQPVVAVVNESLDPTVQSAAYNAVPAPLASRTVALPLFRVNHTAWRMVTGVSAMNVGPEPTTVRLEARSAKRGDALVMEVADVGPMETALFWPGQASGEWAIQTLSYGSAIVSADQPLAVVVNDLSLAGRTDSAIYLGVPMEEGQAH